MTCELHGAFHLNVDDVFKTDARILLHYKNL